MIKYCKVSTKNAGLLTVLVTFSKSSGLYCAQIDISKRCWCLHKHLTFWLNFEKFAVPPFPLALLKPQPQYNSFIFVSFIWDLIFQLFYKLLKCIVNYIFIFIRIKYESHKKFAKILSAEMNPLGRLSNNSYEYNTFV